MLSAPIIGIGRHRLGIDGEGVTSLVAFHGCTLRCKYCLNRQCFDPDGIWKTLTVDEVLEAVMPDNIYYLATGGGLCFGGGEPYLHAEFIKAICDAAPKGWIFTVETALNYDRKRLELLLPYINYYLIDIKDTNPDIYQRYTGRNNAIVLENLRWLLNQKEDMADCVVIRLPLIKDFNTLADVAKSKALLQEMGFRKFDEFVYITQPE